MKFKALHGVFLAVCIFGTLKIQAQTSIAGGNWNETAVWSTGIVPTATSTTNANHPLILDTNISIGSGGTYTMNNYVTDLSGGSAYTLTMTGGTLEVVSDTTTFEGAASFTNCTVIVRSGAALVIGTMTKGNKTDITVEAGGYLIVNGDLNNGDGQGTFIIHGIVKVQNNYTSTGGSIEIGGNGDILTGGTITTPQNSSTVFGSRNDCNFGPCSGRNLCGYRNVIGSNQALCPGSAAVPLTSSESPGTGATYIWQSSTTSEVTGFTEAGGASETFPPGIVPQSTWYRRQVTKSGCISVSTPVKITVLPTNGWKGTTSTDWNTATNWCSNVVPTSTTDVVIPQTGNGIPNSPEISSSAVCRSVTINESAQVTINGSNTLAIYGNFNNNGTLVTDLSTVTFTGSSTQTIKGLPTNFYNLTINNSSPNTVIIETYLNVINQLTLTQGNINLSGYTFTLGSSISPGLLSQLSGHFYNGNLTRWLSGAGIPIGNSPGLFPVGTATNYRPMYIGYSGITGGTMRVSHTDAATVSSFLSPIADGGSSIILRHDSNWRVTTADGLNGSNISLQAEGTGYGIINDLNHLRLMLVNSVVGSHVVNSSTPISPITNAQVTRGSLTSANLNNTFYLGSTSALTPLPLILLSFTGSWSTDGVFLEWTTNFEENFDHFLLERSTDGISFEPITRINGEGEKNLIVNTYSYVDADAHDGRYYYRLKQIDLDESFEYSKIITVITGHRGESFTIFPNPVVDGKFTVKISSESAQAQLILYDQYGKIYLTTNLEQGEQEIFIGNTLSSGVYFAKVLGLSTPKIIKLVIR